MKSIFAALTLALCANSFAASCNDVARSIAKQQAINPTELASMLDSLNRSGTLPAQFVTKREAKAAGWNPGESLWQSLPGKSIGGDRFANREKRLPSGKYFEADLDYKGKKRNAKRLIYQISGQRFVTTDHYQTFTEVPPCQ